MDREALAVLHKEHAGQPVTADRLKDLLVYYREQVQEAVLSLEAPDSALIRNPSRIRITEKQGLSAFTSAETILCVMYVFGMLTEEQHDEEHRSLTSLAVPLLVAVS